MAIFHLRTYAISRRSLSGSAVAASAYRSGSKLVQYSTAIGSARAVKAIKKTGRDKSKIHDYSKKTGVASSKLYAPKGTCADHLPSRERLWNMADENNTRTNSRVARELRVALPYEISADMRMSLAAEFAQHLCDKFGIVCDLSIHQPSRSSDERNHHCHLLLSVDRFESGKFVEKSDLERSDHWCRKNGIDCPKEQIKLLRATWAKLVNRYLSTTGFMHRVDHRSNKVCGIEIQPARPRKIETFHKIFSRPNGEFDHLSKIHPEISAENADAVLKQPELILSRCRTQDGRVVFEWVARSLLTIVNRNDPKFDSLVVKLTGRQLPRKPFRLKAKLSESQADEIGKAETQTEADAVVEQTGASVLAQIQEQLLLLKHARRTEDLMEADLGGLLAPCHRFIWGKGHSDLSANSIVLAIMQKHADPDLLLIKFQNQLSVIQKSLPHLPVADVLLKPEFKNVRQLLLNLADLESELLEAVAYLENQLNCPLQVAQSADHATYDF